MKIFHFFAYNLFALSQLFALNFNDVNTTHVSPLGQRFQETRTKYIRLLDSFISAYGQGNGGKFPSYSFTAEQFARYHDQYMIDILSKEKSDTFRNFNGLVLDINIPLEIGSPILLKYFVKDVILDIYLLEAYNEFIKYGNVLNKTADLTEKNEQFKLMLQEQETAQTVAQYLEAENILTLWCEDFLFLMIYGGEYSVDALKNDIKADLFFQGIPKIISKLEAFRQPQFICSYMPSFKINQADPEQQEKQIIELISTLKTLHHPQGIESLAHFNDIQMKAFKDALRKAHYSIGPDDIISFKGIFNLTLSQKRMLLGYKEIGYQKNIKEVSAELSELFSSNAKIFEAFLEFSKDASYVTNDMLSALRKSILTQALEKNHSNNINKLIEKKSGINREFDERLLNEILLIKKNDKAQEDKLYNDYLASIRPSTKKSNKKKSDKKKKPNSNLGQTKKTSPNKTGAKNTNRDTIKVNTPKKVTNGQASSNKKNQATPNNSRKARQTKRKTVPSKPSLKHNPQTTVQEGYTLSPYDGPSDEELRSKLARENRKAQPITCAHEKTDPIRSKYRAIKDAKKFTASLCQRFALFEHSEITSEWNDEISHYQSLAQTYLELYALLSDFYDTLPLIDFSEFDDIIKEFYQPARVVLSNSEPHEMSEQQFMNAYNSLQNSFACWKQKIADLKLCIQKLERKRALIIDLKYQRVKDENTSIEESEESEESSSVEVILRD